ncbi:MAG: type 1 glutamine amidotransferase [Acidimicrobiia bacterium]|nr:type 1 glutamine amidotransferase [Acidimicrobiia bacterium]
MPRIDPIAILEHSPQVPPGYLGDAIAATRLPTVRVRLYDGDALPNLDAVAAVVSLGGVMGAYEEEAHPFLVAEKQFLRKAVARGVRVLGICLGCQLLADALGGRAFKADAVEVEFVGLETSGAATDDPVLSTLATPVVSFHQDTWEPPPGADVLVRSARFPHAFRLGSALAIQSHPEASPEMVADWVASFGRDRLLAAGVDPEAFLEDVRAASTANEARAAALFTAWLAEVTTTVR